ncbi:TetR/AcrR family transcriptional regulator [Planktotalea sp.]|uniref:TetR/AcrR family transcriptional regulator n=1 Tax=Planktotalea sp. TaxID=2029877 RepID=UPI0025E3BAE0|nr:TetR/AcrR family transcriptional regulator [Planktotalea sp.]
MSRLSQIDWIAAGFRALTTTGPQALKAEPLARTLGTTKGSFYWHFKDVHAFQTAMLEHWEVQATQGIIEALGTVTDAVQKLRALAKISTEPQARYSGIGAEPAIRAWAKGDAKVADAVRRVDQDRLEFLAGIFDEMGLKNPDMPRLFYASLIGLQEIADGDDTAGSAPLATLADLMVALSETD